jgi:hypothetical protein
MSGLLAVFVFRGWFLSFVFLTLFLWESETTAPSASSDRAAPEERRDQCEDAEAGRWLDCALIVPVATLSISLIAASSESRRAPRRIPGRSLTAGNLDVVRNHLRPLAVVFVRRVYTEPGGDRALQDVVEARRGHGMRVLAVGKDDEEAARGVQNLNARNNSMLSSIACAMSVP